MLNPHEQHQNALELRRKLPIGACVRLINMHGEAIPQGTVGTIVHIDDAGQIHVRWDTGSRLPLNEDEDEFEVIVCSRCGQPVFRTPVEGYPFQCKQHYEDLYAIETEGVSVCKLPPRSIYTMTSKEVQALLASEVNKIQFSQCQLCEDEAICDSFPAADCRQKIAQHLAEIEVDG